MASANPNPHPSANTQKPLCPVCHQADKVQSLQAMYNEGLERFAPPKTPDKTVSMAKYMFTGMVVVGICVFFIIVLIGSETGVFSDTFSIPELILVSITLIGIITALALSFIAFNHVLRGDQEAEKHYNAWDRAMENYRGLRYCARDDVVFDPKTNKTISEEALASLLTSEAKKEEQLSHTSTSLAH